MWIDCDRCHVRGLACSDCVVTVLLGADGAPAAGEIGADQEAAIGVLADAGMVPPLRLVVDDSDDLADDISQRNTARTFAERREAG